MLQSTVITAYLAVDALLVEEVRRATAETSRDDEGAIGSRDNLVHGPKQQSTNNGVEQIRRLVGIDNTTQHAIIQGRGGRKTVVKTMTGTEGQHSRVGGGGGKLGQLGKRRTVIKCRMTCWWIEPCITRQWVAQ
jgi:hypothetical protein